MSLAETAPQKSWHRVFSGSISEISAAASWVESIAAELGLPGPQLFAMQVCLEELMSNIVRHGAARPPSDQPWSPKAPDKPLSIAITVTALDDRLIMTIEDDGRPFDVAHAQPKAIAQPLDTVKLGGLGIHLVKNFASDLSYSRTENGNRVIVEFSD
jgi:serine/threonine-protein kinase RsbW